MYDIAIIGAGPAGTTLARLIGKNYRVLLVDRRDFSAHPDGLPQEKCCGGLLAPDAQLMLSRLGLGLPKSVLEEPQIFVVKAIDMDREIVRHYQRYYINMNRQKFDHWLLSMLPSGIDIRTNCRLKSYSRVNTHFKLELREGDKSFVEQTKIIIGADGASSKVRRLFGKWNFPEKYFAIQEWVESSDNFPYFTSIFCSKITDYYCWTIPKGNNLIIGAALSPHTNISEKFQLLKENLKACGFQFGKKLRREGAYILRPSGVRQLSVGSKGIALLGEAGGWISPSSAEGLSYALKSALLLSKSLNEAEDAFEKRYSRYMMTLKANILLKNIKSRFIFNPRLRALVMRSKLKSINVIETAGYGKPYLINKESHG